MRVVRLDGTPLRNLGCANSGDRHDDVVGAKLSRSPVMEGRPCFGAGSPENTYWVRRIRQSYTKGVQVRAGTGIFGCRGVSASIGYSTG